LKQSRTGCIIASSVSRVCNGARSKRCNTKYTPPLSGREDRSRTSPRTEADIIIPRFPGPIFSIQVEAKNHEKNRAFLVLRIARPTHFTASTRLALVTFS
jgi:hypothetical protein